MARKTDRNFIADFDTLDIEYLPSKGPEVSDDVQMVYVMGNVAPAGVSFNRFLGVAPPILPQYAILRAGASTGGQGSVGMLTVGGFGIWLTNLNVGNAPGAFQWDIWTTAVRPVLSVVSVDIDPITPLNATSFTGQNSTCTYQTGSNALFAPTNRWRGQGGNVGNAFTGAYRFSEPIYVAPGRTVIVQTIQLADASLHGFWWRELTSLPT